MQTVNIDRHVPTTTIQTNTGSRQNITFIGLLIKTIVAHTVTYFIMGLLALTFLEYRTAFETPITREYMRSVDDVIVALGPALQFIRGIFFAIAFYPLREILFARKNGWLITWLVLVMLGILSPFGAAPGSVEGLLYTKMPIVLQISGWAEVMTQALAAVSYFVLLGQSPGEEMGRLAAGNHLRAGLDFWDPGCCVRIRIHSLLDTQVVHRINRLGNDCWRRRNEYGQYFAAHCTE